MRHARPCRTWRAPDLDESGHRSTHRGRCEAIAGAFDELLAAIEKKNRRAQRAPPQAPPQADDRSSAEGSRRIRKGHARRLEIQQQVQRLWDRDASLWTGTDEAEWLSWLEDRRRADCNMSISSGKSPRKFAPAVRPRRPLGHGRIEPCVEVLKLTFGDARIRPQSRSDPPIRLRSERSTKLDIAKTIFIVSSKSGRRWNPIFSSNISSSA